MKTEDLIALVILGSYATLMTLEALFPARRYPTRFLWRLRGWGFLILMAVLGTVTPLLLPTAWLAEHRLLDLSALGTAAGIAVGWLTVSGVNYLWHRACHRYDLLWRTFHQMHHAPQRLDMGGAAVFHPFDVIGYVTLSTVTTTLVLGLSPEAAALTGLVAQLYAFFQHANIRTPQWLGYLIQRPEGHFVHHQRGVHAWNYGDLPVWDLLLGTFRNPKEFGEEAVGFDAPADGRYGAMLALRDVSGAVGTQVQSEARPRVEPTRA